MNAGGLLCLGLGIGGVLLVESVAGFIFCAVFTLKYTCSIYQRGILYVHPIGIANRRLPERSLSYVNSQFEMVNKQGARHLRL